MNVLLIGMAGAGKTFIGKKLAARLGYGFQDIDDIIRERIGGIPFQEIIDRHGEAYFLEVEREAVLGLKKRDKTVISPGGSVVYMDDAMEHLRRNALSCFLDAPLNLIIERNPTIMSRGIIGLRGGKSLEDVFTERRILYSRYADITYEMKRETDPDILAGRIADALKTLGDGKTPNPPQAGGERLGSVR